MAWTKAKTAVFAGTVLILAAGTTAIIVKNSNHHSQAELQQMPAGKASFEAETIKRMNQAKMSALSCFLFALNHQSQWPKNFADLKASGLGESSLSDSDWEFVSGGNKNSFTNPAQTILFREKKSRQSSDGDSVKVYAFADGHLELLSSRDDDFATLEKQRGFLVQPANN